MSAFQYTAYTAAGRRVRGVLVADGEAHARDMLRSEGLFPESLKLARERAGRSRLWAGPRRRLTVEDLSVFTRQLAVLTAARLPVEEALQVLMRAEVGTGVRRVTAEVRDRVRDGASLSAALSAQSGAFPDFYTAAIAAGESSGELATVCETLADFLETRQAVRDKVVSALVYPAFVGAVSLVVAGILLVNVAPELAAVFEQSGRPLPPITRVSLALGDFLGRNWLAALLVPVALGAGIRALLQLEGVRGRWHALVLRLPLLGRLQRMKAAALFLRTLALVLSSRMPAVSAMRFAVGAIENVHLRAEGQQAANAIEEGSRISAAVRRMSILPPVAVQLIESGESSGRLMQMAERAATIAETALTARTQRLATLLEPIMMMVVGGLVLAIVLSVLLPIFDLQTTFVD